jgi:hypothetical protein
MIAGYTAAPCKLGINLKPKNGCCSPKTAHPAKITAAFEFLVLNLTVPGLSAKNFKILRAFAYLPLYNAP